MSEEHTGNKYHREVSSVHDLKAGACVTADVYCILEAFKVTCPARQHAIKKLLCAGIRGKNNEEQDLREARDAVTRAMELATVRKNLNEVSP